jgi:hypothetical protein
MSQHNMSKTSNPLVKSEHDSNLDLLGINGPPGHENKRGVFDFSTAEWRPLVPTDGVTLSTGHSYIAYDPDSPSVAFIDAYMRNLFPDEIERERVWSMMAATLQGRQDGNTFKHLYGDGGNGKTTLVQLLMSAMGQYAQRFSPEVFDSIIFDDEATSDGWASQRLGRLRGTRLITIELYNDSGSDMDQLYHIIESCPTQPFRARLLFRTDTMIVPQFTVLTIGQESAITLPVEQFHASRNFRDPGSASGPYADRKMRDKLQPLVDVFLGMLINRRVCDLEREQAEREEAEIRQKIAEEMDAVEDEHAAILAEMRCDEPDCDGEDAEPDTEPEYNIPQQDILDDAPIQEPIKEHTATESSGIGSWLRSWIQ